MCCYTDDIPYSISIAATCCCIARCINRETNYTIRSALNSDIVALQSYWISNNNKKKKIHIIYLREVCAARFILSISISLYYNINIIH